MNREENNVKLKSESDKWEKGHIHLFDKAYYRFAEDKWKKIASYEEFKKAVSLQEIEG